MCIVPIKPSAAALNGSRPRRSTMRCKRPAMKPFLCFADSQRSRVCPVPVLKRGDQFLSIQTRYRVSGSRLHRETRLDANADLSRPISNDQVGISSGNEALLDWAQSLRQSRRDTDCPNYICHRNSRRKSFPICRCSNRYAQPPFHRGSSALRQKIRKHSCQCWETEYIAASSSQEGRMPIAV